MDPDRERQKAGQTAPEQPFTDEERALLLKACQRYRSSIPSYIQSGERERSAIDALIRKLSFWTTPDETR